MRNALNISVRLLAVFTVITGLAYPLGVTLLSRVIFPFQAEGSLVYEGLPDGSRGAEGAGAPERRHGDEPAGEGAGGRPDRRVIGSALIGQSFTEPRYFWGRPSATSPPYNASASTGSNLGPSNPALADSIRARIERLRRRDPPSVRPVPVDLVTASGSGLDPQISPAAAYYQVPRFARSRGLDPAAVRNLVDRCLEPRQFGLLGEPRVNVLKLNVALDGLAKSRWAPPVSRHGA